MNEKTEKVEEEEGEREKEKTRARNQILSFSKEDSQVEISRGTKPKLVFVRYSLARSLARSPARLRRHHRRRRRCRRRRRARPN